MKRRLIEPNHPDLSIRRQCKLLDLNRSSFYYQPAGESELNLKLMRLIEDDGLLAEIRLPDQPQTGPTLDADDGLASDLS